MCSVAAGEAAVHCEGLDEYDELGVKRVRGEVQTNPLTETVFVAEWEPTRFWLRICTVRRTRCFGALGGEHGLLVATTDVIRIGRGHGCRGVQAMDV